MDANDAVVEGRRGNDDDTTKSQHGNGPQVDNVPSTPIIRRSPRNHASSPAASAYASTATSTTSVPRSRCRPNDASAPPIASADNRVILNGHDDLHEDDGDVVMTLVKSSTQKRSRKNATPSSNKKAKIVDKPDSSIPTNSFAVPSPSNRTTSTLLPPLAPPSAGNAFRRQPPSSTPSRINGLLVRSGAAAGASATIGPPKSSNVPPLAVSSKTVSRNSDSGVGHSSSPVVSPFSGLYELPRPMSLSDQFSNNMLLPPMRAKEQSRGGRVSQSDDLAEDLLGLDILEDESEQGTTEVVGGGDATKMQAVEATSTTAATRSRICTTWTASALVALLAVAVAIGQSSWMSQNQLSAAEQLDENQEMDVDFTTHINNSRSAKTTAMMLGQFGLRAFFTVSAFLLQMLVKLGSFCLAALLNRAFTRGSPKMIPSLPTSIPVRETSTAWNALQWQWSLTRQQYALGALALALLIVVYVLTKHAGYFHTVVQQMNTDNGIIGRVFGKAAPGNHLVIYVGFCILVKSMLPRTIAWIATATAANFALSTILPLVATVWLLRGHAMEQRGGQQQGLDREEVERRSRRMLHLLRSWMVCTAVSMGRQLYYLLPLSKGILWLFPRIRSVSAQIEFGAWIWIHAAPWMLPNGSSTPVDDFVEAVLAPLIHTLYSPVATLIPDNMWQMWVNSAARLLDIAEWFKICSADTRRDVEELLQCSQCLVLPLFLLLTVHPLTTVGMIYLAHTIPFAKCCAATSGVDCYAIAPDEVTAIVRWLQGSVLHSVLLGSWVSNRGWLAWIPLANLAFGCAFAVLATATPRPMKRIYDATVHAEINAFAKGNSDSYAMRAGRYLLWLVNWSVRNAVGFRQAAPAAGHRNYNDARRLGGLADQ